MNHSKEKKNIDYSKTNIGVELECFVVQVDTFENATKEDSQKIFQTLLEKFNWKVKDEYKNEIHSVAKNINGIPVEIKLDVSYAIFEIANVSPCPNLESLEKMNIQALDEFRESLKENDMVIWPFGVAPASTGYLKLPTETSREIVNEEFYGTIQKIDDLTRLCHITSHQISLDIPFEKMLPAINAFYKNLGTIIEKFANSAAYMNGRLYKEGRYYWWLDAGPTLKRWRIPTFPEKEFETWNEFWTWIFDGLGFLMRNDVPYGFRNGTTFDGDKIKIHDLLRTRKVLAFGPDGKDVGLNLQKEDIEFLFSLSWIDFKPHFDFDQNYTLEEFLEYYDKKDLDGFFEKYCKHCWLEIRPCSPHLEENAMILPKYFYDIVQNLDQYIKEAKKISWKEAKIARDKAIGYTK